MEFTCFPAGDKAVLVQFKQEISEEINREVIALARALAEARIPGVVEWVPAYVSLLVIYDPLKTGYFDLVEKINSLDVRGQGGGSIETPAIVHEIPVLYGGKWGMDLEDVAGFHGLSMDEVIQIHSGLTYRVYMLGFAPGFPYLGGLDPRIHTPRLETPRLRIPPGSVGIAGQQTGIYPLATPGGWRIIGHTPIPLFRPHHPDKPVFISAGDYIRFVPVDEIEYNRIKETVKQELT